MIYYLTMVRKDISQFIASIPSSVTIVAATKYVNKDDIITLINNGINNIGENRVDSRLRDITLEIFRHKIRFFKKF